MKSAMTESLTLCKRLAAIHRTITSSLDFEEALGLIAGSGLQLVGASSCIVLLRKGDETLRICAAQGVHTATAERFVGSLKESVLGELRHYLGFPASQKIAASPIVSDSIVKGILVVIRDAPLDSEERWLLSALADQAAITLGNAHLHETLVSREARLEDEVERTRKLARELEALIQSVAQDLRVPLQTLAGCRKLLRDEYGEQRLTGRAREVLIRMAAGARTMKGMIHDLLAYTDLAGTELNLEPLELEEVISEALAELEEEIKGRGGAVRVEPPLFKVLAHRRILVRILGDLLANAVHVVNPGGPQLIEVRAELLGEFVRVSVVNNGIRGVFERPERTEEDDGTGVGLVIVQRGLERMGGRIGVESASGQGNRFWIELRGA